MPQLGSSNPQPWVTSATYYRLYLSEILPDLIEKVIYLDSDILVRHDLEELWNVEISDYSIACVQDCNAYKDEHYERLQYPKEKGYFNAGMLLVNLKYWREHEMIDKFVHFIQHHSDRIKLHDQDVLNYVLRDSKKEVNLKWNFQEDCLKTQFSSSLFCQEKEWEEVRNNPAIIHFTGPLKPWFSDCQHPFKKLYLAYMKQTKWKSYQLVNSISIMSSKRKVRRCAGNVLRFFHILPYIQYDFVPIEMKYNIIEQSVIC